MDFNLTQSLFAVLLVFALGDFVGVVTRARISSIFVIMMSFLVLFMMHVYPADVVKRAGLTQMATIGIYFLLVNMGTTADIATLKKEWRTVVTAIIGMIAAALGCLVCWPIIGKEYVLTAIPVVNGGIIACRTMVAAAEAHNLPTAAALAAFIYATQKFVGTLPASNFGLIFADKFVKDLRAKHEADPNYSWYAENAGEAKQENEVQQKVALFWEKNKKFYTVFMCLGIAAGCIAISGFLAKFTGKFGINITIWCMIMGIILRNCGLVPGNVLRDVAKSNGFFSFVSMCTIVPALAKVNLNNLGSVGFATLCCFAGAVLFIGIVFFLTPAWKICGDKHFAVGISMCQMLGYPGTELTAMEVIGATAKTDEERDALTAKLNTAYVISGFTSVSLLSIVVASILANMM